MKRSILYIFLGLTVLAGSLSAAAQNGGRLNAEGRTTDPQGNPVGFATVILIQQTDSTCTYGALSDEDGHFSIRAPRGDYRLKASFLGYETLTNKNGQTRTATSPQVYRGDNPSLRLGTIYDLSGKHSVGVEANLMGFFPYKSYQNQLIVNNPGYCSESLWLGSPPRLGLGISYNFKAGKEFHARKVESGAGAEGSHMQGQQTQ